MISTINLKESKDWRLVAVSVKTNSVLGVITTEVENILKFKQTSKRYTVINYYKNYNNMINLKRTDNAETALKFYNAANKYQLSHQAIVEKVSNTYKVLVSDSQKGGCLTLVEPFKG